MDMPLAKAEPDAEPLLDEAGFEYRLDAAGEREYHHPEPGEDPEYDAWLRAEVEQAIREADAPDAVFIDHEDVKRESAAWRAELLAKLGAGANTD
jgi:hypothetical protein